MNKLSNEITPRFFTQVPSYLNGRGLSSSDKLIYGIVYTMLNVTGKCFMSNARIADAAELKIGTTKNSLTKLKKLGLIQTTKTYKPGSKEVDKRFITIQVPPSQINDDPITNECQPRHLKVQDNKSINRLSNNNATTTADTQNSNSELKDKFTAVLTFYQNNIGVLNPITTEDIMYWCNDLSPEVVTEAIRRTAQSNKNWRYTTGILRDWVKHNIKTLDQIKASDVEFQKKNEAKYGKRKNNKPAPQYKAGDDAYRRMAQNEAEGKLPWED